MRKFFSRAFLSAFFLVLSVCNLNAFPFSFLLPKEKDLNERLCRKVCNAQKVKNNGLTKNIMNHYFTHADYFFGDKNCSCIQKEEVETIKKSWTLKLFSPFKKKIGYFVVLLKAEKNPKKPVYLPQDFNYALLKQIKEREKELEDKNSGSENKKVWFNIDGYTQCKPYYGNYGYECETRMIPLELRKLLRESNNNKLEE